ncbi:hypothetical protein B4U80_14583, partial [Leptotrombidium deliense]
MFLRDKITSSNHIYGNFHLHTGFRVSDFGRFEYYKLSDGTLELYMQQEEFDFLIEALNNVQSSSKNFGHKKMSIIASSYTTVQLNDQSMDVKKPYKINWSIDDIVRSMRIPESVRNYLAVRALKAAPPICESFTHYGWLNQRRDTFKNWPKQQIPIEKLIRAGFYYTGVVDA